MIVSDNYSNNTLIDAFGTAGRMVEAWKLSRRMEKEGCDEMVFRYTILISGLFEKHKNEETLSCRTR